jgi:uncharacterized GH25 family protein
MLRAMKRPLVIGGIGLIVLISAIYFFVFRDKAAGKKPAVAPAAADTTPVATRASADQPARAGGDGRAARELEFLEDDDPAGILVLEGQVIDDKEQPVKGAQVVLESTPPRTVTTEEDGSFAFDKLVARPYTLVARAAAGVAGPVTARLNDKTEPVILRLTKASSISVDVFDAAKNTPIAGATVELRDIDAQTATTGADGKAAIAPVVPGGYLVVAWATGYAKEYQFTRVTGDRTEVRLALRRGAAVSGHVVASDGKPVADARVLYSGASEWGTQADERRDAAVTDAKGAFRVEGLPAGTFRFIASHKDFAPGSSAMVTLDGASERGGVEIALEAAATISGRVVDDAGKGLPSARVRVAVKASGMISAAPRQAYTDDTGAFSIGGLPRKVLELVALHDSGSSDLVDVDASGAAAKAVELKISVTGTIAGIVVDDKGEPIEGAQVSAGPNFRGNRGGGLSMSSWRLRGFPRELTDAGGRFTLRGLAAGSYMVSATRGDRGGVGRMFGGGGEGVEAETGATDLRIVLAPEGGLKGKVAFADGTVPSAFTIGVGWRNEPYSSKDGSFTLDGLAPRDYTVTVRGAGFDSKQVAAVKVTSSELKDVGTIVVARGRSLSGRVVAGGQPVANATVRAGRQVFGDGSSTKAQMGGPPGAGRVKDTTTDAEGAFTLSGVGNGRLYIVADEPSIGRSASLLLPGSAESVDDLELQLQPFGALSGTVTIGGKPSAGTIVSVTSTLAPGVSNGVATGEDGTYRLDKLAPDTYKVSAMFGMGMMGMRTYSKTVTLAPKQEAKVDLVVTEGPITIEVTPVASDGQPPGAVIAQHLAGRLDPADYPKTAAELELLVGKLDWRGGFNVSIMGSVAKMEGLFVGPTVVCGMPMPREIQGMSQAMDYTEREGDALPVFCQELALAESPATQPFSLAVTVPPYVPAPGETPPEK